MTANRHLSRLPRTLCFWCLCLIRNHSLPTGHSHCNDKKWTTQQVIVKLEQDDENRAISDALWDHDCRSERTISLLHLLISYSYHPNQCLFLAWTGQALSYWHASDLAIGCEHMLDRSRLGLLYHWCSLQHCPLLTLHFKHVRPC